ncbi:citrate:proton symporter [Pseudonocardia nematodicida]|uniref:Citrate:proton symporter n=1 Tax=Pseudonocardia nematodicida TaxID=1206997 RepID=A0ABV1KDU1_9PSEU
MLALAGFVALMIFVALVASGRVHVLVALVLVPVAAALVVGDGSSLGEMVKDGVLTVAPTGMLILFSVLFFSTMIDTGLFTPLVDAILRRLGEDPLKITLGTALLTLVVSLDGDGTTTFIIVTLSLYPLYRRCGMSPLVLMALTTIGFYIMNSSPWGGPTTRTMAVLDLSVSEAFVPLLPGLMGGIVFLFVMAVILGRRERARLGWSAGVLTRVEEGREEALVAAGRVAPGAGPVAAQDQVDEFVAGSGDDEDLLRPRLRLLNLALTVVVMISVIFEILPPYVTFLIGFVVALLVNFRATQVERIIRKHAGNALWATVIIFAAGAFTGILTGTGMIGAMATSIVDVVPDALGNQLALMTTFLSFASTLVMSPDAFYFGMLPVLAETGVAYGLEPAEVGRAALLGQVGYGLSPLVAAPLLFASLLKVSYINHQKFTIGWAFGCTLAMLLVSVLVGAVPVI